MDFPIKGEASHLIARGAFCAGKQKKFWEFHDLAFENQSTLSDKSPVNFAKKLGLNSKSLMYVYLPARQGNTLINRRKRERIGITAHHRFSSMVRRWVVRTCMTINHVESYL